MVFGHQESESETCHTQDRQTHKNFNLSCRKSFDLPSVKITFTLYWAN